MASDPASHRPRASGRRLRDEEPFATMAAFPGRFGVGVPVVFLVAILSGSFVASAWNLSGGIALLLVIQTGGLLGLYVPAWRRRRASASGEASKPPS